MEVVKLLQFRTEYLTTIITRGNFISLNIQNSLNKKLAYASVIINKSILHLLHMFNSIKSLIVFETICISLELKVIY